MAAHQAGASNIVVANAAVSTCSKGGEWQKALHLLNDFGFYRLEPTAITFNSVLDATQQKMEWGLALRLLQRMQEEEVVPDTIGYSTAINACATGELPGRAQELIVELELRTCLSIASHLRAE
eukprot:s1961_g2.t1